MNQKTERLLPHSIKPVVGQVSLPGSKSLTHRALVVASLAEGDSIVEGALLCDDTRYTLEALRAMGARITVKGDRLQIRGVAGKPLPVGVDVALGASGTSLRFLLSIAALASGKTRFFGQERLMERPIMPLIEALKSLGAKIRWGEKSNILEVEGGAVQGGEVDIPGGVSSQFISSLLMMAPCTQKGISVHVSGTMISRPYIDLTIGVMSDFGVLLEKDPSGFRVPGNRSYRPCSFQIEGDLSSAGYFWAAAAVTRGNIVTEGVLSNTRQGDLQLLAILERMGCRVERSRTSVCVEGGTLKGVEVNMADLPDQVPTLASVALFAQGTTRITGVSHLRQKESNRLESLGEELRKTGAGVEILADGMAVEGHLGLRPAVLDPHDDHRLAMSFAVLGLGLPGLRLSNPDCVGKSFPGFWESWTRLVA